MIIGSHSIIYSTNAEADRAFFRDVLKMPNVDIGDGWFVFGLPPSDVAVHPAKTNNVHEFYLLCDNINAFIKEMDAQKIVCSPVSDEGWGLLSQMTLPGGGKLGIYEPRHARPKSMKVSAAKTKKPSSGKSAKKN